MDNLKKAWKDYLSFCRNEWKILDRLTRDYERVKNDISLYKHAKVSYMSVLKKGIKECESKRDRIMKNLGDAFSKL